VKLTGSISKITKGIISSKAKFRSPLSDGAQGAGMLKVFIGGSAGIPGSLSKAGARMP
jgi:hypothetical protein